MLEVCSNINANALTGPQASRVDIISLDACFNQETKFITWFKYTYKRFNTIILLAVMLSFCLAVHKKHNLFLIKTLFFMEITKYLF